MVKTAKCAQFKVIRREGFHMALDMNFIHLLTRAEMTLEIESAHGRTRLFLEGSSAPSRKDMDFLTQKIHEETPDFGAAYPFAFFVRDEQRGILAGCNGSVVFGCIYTDQWWVHGNHRQRGWGTSLMERVHIYGREEGCTMATVATMNFQGAQKFYEKLGYEVDFERAGYTRCSRCHFMRKKL